MNWQRSMRLLPLITVVLFVSSCAKKTTTLNLLVWEGYADPSFVKAFEGENHCKISASYMGSSDELMAKLRGGSAGCHVSRKLLMARGIGDNERPSRRCKKPVRYVNRNSLFAFRFQTIEQKRKIDVTFCCTLPLRIFDKSGQLVLENELAVVQKAADQCGLAIIDRPACY